MADIFLYCVIVVSAIMTFMITGYTCVVVFYVFCCKKSVQEENKRTRAADNIPLVSLTSTPPML